MTGFAHFLVHKMSQYVVAIISTKSWIIFHGINSYKIILLMLKM